MRLQKSSNYLGKEFTGSLAVPLEGAGEDSTSGSTRQLIVEQRESLRHQLLNQALRLHPDKQARPVTVFQNVSDDKVAGRWLLTCPSPDLGLSSPVFQEALSSHLCLPSPVIRDGAWLGRRACQVCGPIDKWGDTVMCCKHVVGDTYRRRHDTIKQHLVSEAALAGVPLDCEVFGQFSDLPAHLMEEGGELVAGRQRQGMGLACQEELAPLAFMGTLEQALSFFGGEEGVCPTLQAWLTW